MSPPDDLAEDTLAAALLAGWAVTVASMAYRTVGFGSHHWEVVGGDGVRWFVTVDELEAKRQAVREPLTDAFDRLRASLTAAGDLRAHGLTFVVAPVSTLDGAPLVRIGDRYALALYPFVDGQSFRWGDFSAPGHRAAVLDLLVAVHTVPPAGRSRARVDDFAIPHRDELVASLESTAEVDRTGPYTRLALQLLAGNAGPVRRLLARYDELVVAGRAGAAAMVLTHGEPHPGNTMLTADGWRLIDWDTALVAPPERDLWGLDPGDGSILAGYADATGRPPLPSMLELYRIRWDLADLAVYVSRFRRRHAGNLDDDECWEILRALIARISG